MSKKRIAVALAIFGLVVVASSSDWLYVGQAWAEEQTQSDPALQSANRGPFSLVDSRGRAVTDRDFLGKFMLVFFGYTYCPDVCPTDLQIMSDAIDILGAAGKKVQPLFITVDPERDTPQVLAEYVSNFHPRLIGLTGTLEQVATAAKVYHARYRKFYPLVLADIDNSGERAGKEAEENTHYLMDHTAAIVLVGPDGVGLSLYPHGITSEAIADDIQRFIDRPQ